MWEILFIIAIIGVANSMSEIIKYYKRNKKRWIMIEEFEKNVRDI